MGLLQWVYVLTGIVSLLSFGVAYWFFVWLKKQPSSNEKIATIAGWIKKGANTFLKREYLMLAKFVGVASVLIFLFLPKPIWQADSHGYVLSNIMMVIAYVAGSVFSGIAGKIGLSIATTANVKAAEGAQKDIQTSFMAGFRGGAVMGMAVVGSCLLGVALLFGLTFDTFGDAKLLLGFSFGASSLALFAKAGGGIFTKTADISADLVGKVELGIPEDDPRNPAVIADNVGDNVGDVAGMGADLFDSNVASLSAAIVIAIILGPNYIPLVFIYASIGLFASIIGVSTAKMGKKKNPTFALNSSTYLTTIIFAVSTGIVTIFIKGMPGKWYIWGATAIGLLIGVIIGVTTDYFTNDNKKPVRQVAKASESGPAFTIISGSSYGFMSVLPAMIGIALTALISYFLGVQIPVPGVHEVVRGMFGVSMAAVGMLSIVGMIISNDAYGPIVDNARGLAEMGNLGNDVLRITDELDSAGNTVKAVTKGFAIGAAGLTVIALLGAFLMEVGVIDPTFSIIDGFNVMDPIVFFGLIIGAAVPPVFSALLMLGVNRNAQRMIEEIHRQFDEIPGLKEGKEGVIPEYDRCIDIATKGALHELIIAGLFAILITLIVGFVGGVKAIGGFLVGNIVVGLFLALYMSNSGGLWDNTKKYIEAGNHGGKGSDAHKSAVIGDTVGDPYKDTAGPSINTQITVVSLVASLVAGLFVAFNLVSLF
ncbi:MAG: sodium-translocating pyrophosphatase [Acholeplasmataceae bacterium]